MMPKATASLPTLTDSITARDANTGTVPLMEPSIGRGYHKL